MLTENEECTDSARQLEGMLLWRIQSSTCGLSVNLSVCKPPVAGKLCCDFLSSTDVPHVLDTVLHKVPGNAVVAALCCGGRRRKLCCQQESLARPGWVNTGKYTCLCGVLCASDWVSKFPEKGSLKKFRDCLGRRKVLLWIFQETLSWLISVYTWNFCSQTDFPRVKEMIL